MNGRGKGQMAGEPGGRGSVPLGQLCSGEKPLASPGTRGIASCLPMALRFCILGSGSEGNCALLQTQHARVLVDAGFSARRIAQLLAAVGESLDRIDAIFLTHEHGDHAAGIGGLTRRRPIKVFANHATARAVQAGLKHRPDWQFFETGARFRFRDLEVESFAVPHDAHDPVAFLFTHGADDLFTPAAPSGLAHRPRPRARSTSGSASARPMCS